MPSSVADAHAQRALSSASDTLKLAGMVIYESTGEYLRKDLTEPRSLERWEKSDARSTRHAPSRRSRIGVVQVAGVDWEQVGIG